jgi:hypothetical protein
MVPAAGAWRGYLVGDDKNGFGEWRAFLVPANVLNRYERARTVLPPVLPPPTK